MSVPEYLRVAPTCVAAQSLTLGGSTEYVVMNWKPEAGTRITIVPLDGDKARIKTFEMPSFFTFHYVNAFESGAAATPSRHIPCCRRPCLSAHAL